MSKVRTLITLQLLSFCTVATTDHAQKSRAHKRRRRRKKKEKKNWSVDWLNAELPQLAGTEIPEGEKRGRLCLTLHCHHQNDDYTWRYTVTTRMMTIPNPTQSPPEWWLYLTLHCRHRNDSCVKDGQRCELFQCFINCEGHSQKTMATNHNLFEEKGEPKRNRTEVPLPTSLTARPNRAYEKKGKRKWWTLTHPNTATKQSELLQFVTLFSQNSYG